MPTTRLLLPLLFAAVLLAGIARADHRVALLIANSEYEGAKLTAPASDVRALETALVKRGFRTTVVENADKSVMQSAINNFARSAPTRGTALVYFTGLAPAGSDKSANDTFLVPGPVALAKPNELSGRALSVRALLATMHNRCGATNIVVLIDDRSPISNASEKIPGKPVPAKPAAIATAPSASAPAGITAIDDLPPNTLLALSGNSVGVEKQSGAEAAGDSSLAGALVSNLGDAKISPIEAIRRSARWSGSTLDPTVSLAGPATQVVAPPNVFPVGKKAGDEWVNSIGMVFCWCPPGSFIMGSPTNFVGKRDDESPEKVTFDDGFWIGKYEVTLLENPRNKNGQGVTVATKNLPLSKMNQDDGRMSLARNLLTGEQRRAGSLPEDWVYDLPSEQAWEYAARAGIATRYYFGDDESLLPLHGNFADRAAFDSGDLYYNYAHRTLNDGHAGIAPVGSYRANPWGLHDVYGNVAEWCDSSAMRGGSYLSPFDVCRSAYRNRWPNRDERDFIGFRLVIRKQLPTDAKK